MNNWVVYNLYYVFYCMGFIVMCFNFWGVGWLQGEFDQGIGELLDVVLVLDYLQVMNFNSKYCWVVGFSFGVWIGMQFLMCCFEIIGFISVVLFVNMYDFSFFVFCLFLGLIINGIVDWVVLLKDMYMLVGKLCEQKGIIIIYDEIEGVDYFFCDDEIYMKLMIDMVQIYVCCCLIESLC